VPLAGADLGFASRRFQTTPIMGAKFRPRLDKPIFSAVKRNSRRGRVTFMLGGREPVLKQQGYMEKKKPGKKE